MATGAKYHPSQELLLEFATGGGDRPHRALIEAHLAHCAACRSDLGRVARPGGALLTAVDDAPLPPVLLDRIVQRIDSMPALPPQPADGIDLPPGVLAELVTMKPLRWRSPALRGSRIATLLHDDHTGAVLHLGWMPGGRVFPPHRHAGAEEVVVLAGGYTDGPMHVETGDWVVTEPGAPHSPTTDPDEDCWILTRLDAPIRFTGWRGWLQRVALLFARLTRR